MLFIVFLPTAIADNKDEISNFTGTLDKITMSDAEKNTSPDNLEMNIWCSTIENEGIKKTCWDATEARFNYYKQGLEHRSNVFRWQHFSSKIIFIIVLIVVSIGLYFSWIQFKKDIARDDADAANNSLEVSTSGIKVSSPVLGIIILSLSLVFFYLYLVFVYPIKEII